MTRRPAQTRLRQRTVRRGVTFLEVVLAGALLSLSAGAITSAFSFVERMSDRDRRRLEAYEVAHRAILQYLDDPTAMDKEGKKIYALGRGKYRLIVGEEMLSEADGAGENVSVRRKKVTAGVDLMSLLRARVLMVTVEVFEDIEGERSVEPLAVMSRIFDPLSNADDPEAQQKHIENLFKGSPEILEKFKAAAKQRNPGGAPGSPGSPGSPANPGNPGASPTPKRITPGAGGTP